MFGRVTISTGRVAKGGLKRDWWFGVGHLLSYMVRVRAKRWSFTLNNPTDQEELSLKGLVSSGQASYIVIGKERGESGTFHFQGYVEVTSRLELSSVKLLIPRAHLEKSRGSAQSNLDYCTKEDRDAFVDGSPMQQGRRTDLLEIKEAIDEGTTPDEIADSHFGTWVVYRRSFEAYAARNPVRRNFKTQVHVLWGKTGTGKTRFCHDQVMDQQVWTPGDFQWFDGYSGQELVIIDDYRGEYSMPMILKLLDRYPMQVPIKGGFTNWRPKKVYITSNVPPEQWYDCDFPSREALKRRFTSVQEITEPIFPDISILE